MKITLVTASFNDIVHGTFNDKKTGCGINLLKPDTASRYHRSGQMTDLGEITCEKCKSKIAKEIIKADSKEMKLLLKEERMRAKKGLDEDGLVALSELEVKPTGQYTEPEPETAESVTVNNNSENNKNPVYTDDLAQFAIQKSKSEPDKPAESEQEDDFLNQFAIRKPQEEPDFEPEPENDFLAQFAIQKSDENISAENIVDDDDEEDFLAQFSISSPAKTDDYEEPEKLPVIDDISSVVKSIQKSPDVNVPPESYKNEDDILSMFSLESKNIQTEDNLFSSHSDEKQLSNILQSEPEIEDISVPVPDDFDTPEIEDISVPIPDDFDTPEIEDISVPVPDDFDTPEIEDISVPIPDDFDTPEIEDISVPIPDDFDTPEIEDISVHVPDDFDTPEIEDISVHVPDDFDTPEFEDIYTTDIKEKQAIRTSVPEYAQPVTTPVIDDISEAVTALNTQPIKQATPSPVQQITPPPVQQFVPPPIQYITPPPIQQTTPPPVQPIASAGAMGQIMSVPQLTGYDQNGQPIYTYVQMQLQGYDQNGQPIFIPILEQSMSIPVTPTPSPVAPASTMYNKNTRLQEAVAAAQEIPTSSMNMTPGQRIAAAEAAKGSPVSANVSKIATNPHARSTSQAFISAISESKEYANKSLTETQGLKPKTNVLDSIEDVLSQLGDNSLKEKKEAEAKLKQNIPVFNEYKAPQKNSGSFSSPVPSASKSPSANMMDVPLSKADQKALKKQQKIDAKFQKEMAKRKK